MNEPTGLRLIDARRYVLSYRLQKRQRLATPLVCSLTFAAQNRRFDRMMPVQIRAATPADIPLVLAFIRELAAYEKLSHEVEATEEKLHATLFGEKPAAECLLAFVDDAAKSPAGFAIYFTNYSTFLAKPGLYLEDLFVKSEFRGRGIGKSILLHLARVANQRGCGRMEWAVLDWNKPAIAFYDSLGAQRMIEWQICRLTGASLSQYR